MVDLLDPRHLAFWSAEEKKLWDQIAPAILEILFAGGMSGHDALPSSAKVLLDWDLFNEEVIKWLKGWRGGIFREMTDWTREQTVNAITEWVQSGEALPVLEARLEPLFGQMRAHRIAVTEVTRMYAEGNIMSWKATGRISGKRWNTANDDRVCAICGPLDGVVVGIDEGFTPSGGGFGPTAPPAHVNCRCWVGPVIDTEDVREARRRRLGL